MQDFLPLKRDARHGDLPEASDINFTEEVTVPVVIQGWCGLRTKPVEHELSLKEHAREKQTENLGIGEYTTGPSQTHSLAPCMMYLLLRDC